MDGIVPVLVLVGIMVAIGSAIWHFGRAHDLLETWATEQGYTILERQRHTLLRGPFSFTTAKGQEVYSVTVQDGAGRVRRGYVRVGGWMFGMMSDRVAVRWEEDTPGG